MIRIIAAACLAAAQHALAAPAKADAQLARQKARLEIHLKKRLDKIKKQHQERLQFVTEEGEAWKGFWGKLRDERNLFEVRMTRQTLDLFESLSSLDPKVHAQTVGDFERMHANVTRSFDQQEKEKMQQFFATRDAHWNEFARRQEEVRTVFAADAEKGWEENKSALHGQELAPQAREEAPEQAPEEEAPPKKLPPKRHEPSKDSMRPPGYGQDRWN